MQVLSKETFEAAMQKCQETDGYKVLVVTEYLEQRNFILDHWTSGYLNSIKSMNKIDSRIIFLNNSSIKLVGISSNYVRSQRVDLVLCHEWMIYDREIRPVLQVIESHPIDFKLKTER